MAQEFPIGNPEVGWADVLQMRHWQWEGSSWGAIFPMISFKIFGMALLIDCCFSMFLRNFNFTLKMNFQLFAHFEQ